MPAGNSESVNKGVTLIPAFEKNADDSMIDFQRLTGSLPYGIALLSFDGFINTCSGFFEELTGAGEESSALNLLEPKQRAFAVKVLSEVERNKRPQARFTVSSLRNADGSLKAVNQKWNVGRYSGEELLLSVEDLDSSGDVNVDSASEASHPNQAPEFQKNGDSSVVIAAPDGEANVDALREGLPLFNCLLECNGNAVFMLDLKGHFLFANSAFEQLVGVDKNALIGAALGDVLTANLEKVILEQNLLVLTANTTLAFELVLETAGGARMVSISRGLYRNHQNEIAGIFGVITDITDRKQADQRLKKSEQHFRALIENGADRLGLMAQDGTILYASSSSKRILGYEVHDLVGTNAFLLVHPDDLMVMKFQFGELIRLPGASITGQYRALHKNGGWQWMEFTATNFLADESVEAIVVNERDISERKRAEQEMMRFAAIVESSNDAIIGGDISGVITSWNSAAERIFGYSEAEIVGCPSGKLVPTERIKEYTQIRAAALRGKAAEDFETVRVGKDGRRIEVSLTISPIRGRNLQVEGFSEIMRDITERRRLEKEILEISDRERQRLGQDLHDDLCQHLVGISLVGNLLYEDLARLGMKQAEDAKQVTELIRKAVDQARSLARGLSPLNLVDSGFMAALEALVIHTEQLFRIPCVFECRSPVYMKSASVAMHLYRIAQEALHNAVKHSRASKVTVTLNAAEGAITISVSDNGIGMPEQGVPAHGSGAGLGLHTMQYRARIIGATLEIKKNPESGVLVFCRISNRRGSV